MTTRIAAFRLLSPAPQRLAAFYQDVLGFQGAGDGRFTLGPSVIEIAQADTAYPPGVSGNDPRFQHLAIVVADMPRAFAALAQAPGWTAISLSGPEQLPVASGGVGAFKFRDADGHPLELLAFPAAGTPARWQGREGLFLGIDHSAIAVADVERSIAFYARLGFRVASRQTNRGIEQGRLDGLATAGRTEVAIASLMADEAGPHLELLSYATPPMQAAVPVAPSSAAATRVVLRGTKEQRGTIADPDGHRLECEDR